VALDAAMQTHSNMSQTVTSKSNKHMKASQRVGQQVGQSGGWTEHMERHVNSSSPVAQCLSPATIAQHVVAHCSCSLN
jgi:hypothetical protein